jgi:hypothetical protein
MSLSAPSLMRVLAPYRPAPSVWVPPSPVLIKGPKELLVPHIHRVCVAHLSFPLIR